MIAILGIIFSKPGIAILGIVFGFGTGRVKNAGKLAAIQTEVTNFESTVAADAYAVIAKIKSKL